MSATSPTALLRGFFPGKVPVISEYGQVLLYPSQPFALDDASNQDPFVGSPIGTLLDSSTTFNFSTLSLVLNLMLPTLQPD